ncbi:MAG: energy-coupling factor ABC transporter permease [Acidimicrobiales bacterium]
MIAMHAPDGLLSAPVALVTAVISVAVLAVAVHQSGRQLGDRQAPLAGLAAAFIFAAQMVNVPVAGGTSGHLLGGTLAAVLLGPWVGAVVVGVVVLVQALVFADGGITALGYNLLDMAIVPTFAGWALFVALRRVMPARASGVVGAAALAAGLSTVLAAATFSLLWLFGATAPVPFDTVFGSMVGVHTLIGVLEAVITGSVLGAVLATRPDLVYGGQDLRLSPSPGRGRVDTRTFVIGAVFATLVVAVVVSQFAADTPDGLDRVSGDHGMAPDTDHAMSSGPFADYATEGVGNETVSLALAGTVGAALTLLVGGGMLSAARRMTGSVAVPPGR